MTDKQFTKIVVECADYFGRTVDDLMQAHWGDLVQYINEFYPKFSAFIE